MSAAAGGVTTCVDMPYDVPRPVTDAAILQEKAAWVERLAHVDVALYGTIRKEGGAEAIAGMARSEEHTSELQSRQYLVCRLLLEKKKKQLSDNEQNEI